MTLQEAFDKAVAGLAEQGFVQAKSELSCRYRFDGRKCAVGHLIPDEMYKTRGGESETLRNYGVALGVMKHDEDHEGYYFLFNLQSAHDSSSASTSEGMKTNLVDFAGKYGLILPEVLR